MTFTARIMISSAKREDFLSPLYMCCPPVPSKANISVFFLKRQPFMVMKLAHVPCEILGGKYKE